MNEDIMRMSHEIFNCEWNNEDSIYLYTESGISYSAFIRSAQRLSEHICNLRLGKTFWGGEEFPAIHSIPLKKILKVFPGDHIFIDDFCIRIIATGNYNDEQ